MQRQRMDRPLKLLRQSRVDRLMSLNLPFALESVTDQSDLKVTFRPGRHIVLMAFVEHFKVNGSEDLHKLVDN